MGSKKHEITWLIKYLFPGLFIFLFSITINQQPWSQFSIDKIDFTETAFLIAELIVLYLAFYFLTVEYEIAEDRLIVRSFWFVKKTYDIKSIRWMDEDGIISFMGQVPVGIDLTTLNYRSGKKIRILGLKEPLKFKQEIYAIQASDKNEGQLA